MSCLDEFIIMDETLLSNLLSSLTNYPTTPFQTCVVTDNIFLDTQTAPSITFHHNVNDAEHYGLLMNAQPHNNKTNNQHKWSDIVLRHAVVVVDHDIRSTTTYEFLMSSFHPHILPALTSPPHNVPLCVCGDMTTYRHHRQQQQHHNNLTSFPLRVVSVMTTTTTPTPKHCRWNNFPLLSGSSTSGVW